MMEKFKTFYQFSHDRINITSIWVWFSNKVFNYFKNEKINFSKVILKLEYSFYQNIYIYMCDSILEFDQSWNFFHQLYNYSKKILYETQQNIYI